MHQAPLEMEKENVSTLVAPVFTTQNISTLMTPVFAVPSPLSRAALTTSCRTTVDVHQHNQNTEMPIMQPLFFAFIRFNDTCCWNLMEFQTFLSTTPKLPGFYTSFLVRHLTDPELEVKAMFFLVAKEVFKQSQHKQRPVSIFVTAAP